MAKKQTRYQKDARYAEVARGSSRRASYLYVLCRAFVRKECPAVYRKLQDAAYKKHPRINDSAAIQRVESRVKEILDGDANDK